MTIWQLPDEPDEGVQILIGVTGRRFERMAVTRDYWHSAELGAGRGTYSWPDLLEQHGPLREPVAGDTGAPQAFEMTSGDRDRVFREAVERRTLNHDDGLILAMRDYGFTRWEIADMMRLADSYVRVTLDKARRGGL